MINPSEGRVGRWVVGLALAIGMSSLSCLSAAEAPVGASSLPWAGLDLGQPGVAGQFTWNGETVSLEGSGADIWREADSFSYMSLPWEGDGQVVIRVLSVEDTHEWAKAGIMFRDGLSPASKHASLLMTPGQGAAFIRRRQVDGVSADDARQSMRVMPGAKGLGFQQRGSKGTDRAADSPAPGQLPRWLKLVRRGDVFTAFDSADGVTWEWIGTDVVSMSKSIQVGLAVTSHDNTKVCQAVFDSLVVGPAELASDASRGRSHSSGGSGLRASYFGDRNHRGTSVSRVDPVVDFDWGNAAPVEGVGSDRFSVRWEGEFEALFTEPHLIEVVSDDRARLWIDGELVIDEWYEHAESTSTALVSLEAGRRYVVRLDFYENRGRARVGLFWSSPSLPLQVIPQACLFPDITDRDQDGLPDAWERAEGLDAQDRADASVVRAGKRRSALEEYRRRLSNSPRREPASSSANGWSQVDLGRVGRDGVFEIKGGRWIVQGAGADLWANVDGGFFVYQTLRGDGEISARILSQEATDPWAKAGVMIRDGLEADAAHGTAAVTPANGLLFVHRGEVGDLTAAAPGGEARGPVWVRLVRRGELLMSYRSENGVDWKWIGSERVRFSSADIQLGLVVSSHDNSSLGEAVFDQVQVRAGTTDPGESKPGRRGQGTGLNADYLDVATGVVVRRVDPTVDFDWADGPPAEGIGPDQFTVRWEGWIEPLSDEVLSLHVTSDDGARLWVDGKLVIDAWSDRAEAATTAQLEAKAGERRAVRMEFYERDRAAVARLAWSSPSIPRQPIPQSQLYPVSLTGRVAAGGATEGPDRPTGNALNPRAAGTSVDEDSITTVQAERDFRAAMERGDLAEGATAAHTVTEMAGASAVERTGRWEADGTRLFAVDRRGALEYDLTLPMADIYRLEIEGASHHEIDLDSGFQLAVWVDGEYLGRTVLDAGMGRVGLAHFVTPYLAPGQHRVRVLWDNGRKGRSLEVRSIRAQVLDGPDQDHDGVKDWVEKRLREANGFGLKFDPAPAVLSSRTSPASIEGRGRFINSTTASADGAVIPLIAGPDETWGLEVPLVEARETQVNISFENGGYAESRQLKWLPTRLGVDGDQVVRRGDALLVSFGNTGSAEPTVIEVIDGIRYEGTGDLRAVVRFDRDGEFEVRGTTLAADGTTASESMRVRVVSAALEGRPAVWVGKSRKWVAGGVPEGAVIQADRRLTWETLAPTADGGRVFQVGIDAAESRCVVVRLGAGGPILSRTWIDGFTVYSASRSDLGVINTLEDGTQLIEMTVVLSPVIPGVRFEAPMLVGGVVFEDGTVIAKKDAETMSELGEWTIRFLRPARVRTSVCHRLRAWQGTDYLGEY